MPYEGFNSVYDIIKQMASKIRGKKYQVERADEHYSTQSIWCRRICSNIRKAKYCIVDTTGCNPNVFYELGFAHAIEKTESIIITQNIHDAPFDIREIGHIIYSEKDLPKLRSELVEVIKTLERETLIKEDVDKDRSLNEYVLPVSVEFEDLVYRTITMLKALKIK